MFRNDLQIIVGIKTETKIGANIGFRDRFAQYHAADRFFELANTLPPDAGQVFVPARTGIYYGLAGGRFAQSPPYFETHAA